MKAWLLAIYIFAEGIFFGTKSLFYNPASEETSNFLYFNLLIAGIAAIVLLFNLLKRLKNKDDDIEISKVIVISITFLLFICLGISLLRYNFTDFAVQQTTYFIVFTIPAVILSMIIKERDLANVFSKIKYINIYLTICFMLALRNSTGGHLSMFHELGGASHLTIGYTMSALFGYNAICFMNKPRVFSKFFYLALMVFNVSIILFSGSRGALVSVFAIVLVMLSTYVIKRKKIIQAFLLVVVSSIVVPFIITNQNFSFAIQRIIAGFSADGDESTSQRKELYNLAIDNFSNNPIIGNGIGSFSEKIGRYYYPHNFFLEVLNDFGFMGILAAFLILIFLLRKNLWALKQNYQLHIIVFLFINVFVQLMFSGSYLVSSQFWIVSAILFTVNRNEYKLYELPKSTISRKNNKITIA